MNIRTILRIVQGIQNIPKRTTSHRASATPPEPGNPRQLPDSDTKSKADVSHASEFRNAINQRASAANAAPHPATNSVTQQSPPSPPQRVSEIQRDPRKAIDGGQSKTPPERVQGSTTRPQCISAPETSNQNRRQWPAEASCRSTAPYLIPGR